MPERFKKLNQIQSFQLFCLESYRSKTRVSALKALNDFKKHHVFDFLSEGFDVLHTQSENYILSEIDQFIQKHDHTVSRKHNNNPKA
mgnify:CR=1 FL=1|jgi:hypothetical protein